MSAEEITQSVLRFLEIITQWSIIFLVIVLLRRRELTELLVTFTRNLSALMSRVRKASVGRASVEFAPEAIGAFKETVERGIEQRREQPGLALEFVEKQLEKLVRTIPQERPVRPLEGRSILWVDDQPAGNVYESNYLGELGASITQSQSTEDAEAKIEQSSFDLIISDVAREDDLRAGYDLLNDLMDRRPRIPVVLYTTNAHRKLRQPEVLNYGADVTDRPSDLIDTIVHLIGR